MATQSGITASEELLDSFKALKSGALVITLNDDSTQLIPDSGYTSPSSTDLSSVFNSLSEYFEAQYPTPGYAIIQKEGGDNIFVSFIPDSAPIRQKMLFASTKNTVLQQLGSSNFGTKNILALTDVDELSLSHYEHLINGDNEALLTSDEKILAQINSVQNLNLGQSGDQSFKRELPSMHSTQKSTTSGSNLLFKVDSDLENEISGSLSGKLVVIKIQKEAETLELVKSVSDVTPKTLISSLESAVGSAEASPVYALFGYNDEKVAFIYSCPSGSKVKDRMLYAANKQGFLTHLKADHLKDSQLDVVLEVGDLDEIDISRLEPENSQSSQQSSNNLRFSKPKGPRRR
ncbi:uncharacterized protein CXQ87_002822 [Candidozyma duobushaemuli]|uniref:ADF-H domain-containing protein n=2 Tax=Candidozyma TaxID=3303203 RepID=A0ABX8I260_9ASCO|nr:uncharacterized protein CXQ87_002822 [[Candida] duobushaemulonis]PVH14675.1 hypothetical protein CXQ87_002822 [[Candida] duobushaemulonis]QWU87179.1 hypothetical protein CA3LBN_001444 [[Candida] haemuloni]